MNPRASSGLVVPRWLPRKSSSRGASRASGDLPIDDDACEKKSIQSVESLTKGENKPKLKTPKTSIKGIKMSLLKTADQIGAKMQRSGSRASKVSMECVSISEYDEIADIQETEDGRQSRNAQRKSGLSRAGSVKVTDLDAYMATLERKSMTKSAVAKLGTIIKYGKKLAKK